MIIYTVVLHTKWCDKPWDFPIHEPHFFFLSQAKKVKDELMLKTGKTYRVRFDSESVLNFIKRKWSGLKRK